MLVIESAGLTDTGKRRKQNEDALLVDNELRLFVLADGMGGHQAGEVASRLVVDSVQDHIRGLKDGVAEPMGENQDGTLSPEAGWLLSGIHVCNRVVHQAAASREDRRGMGSTISVLFFNERTLVAANVGDSPIFLIQNGSIELLSEPHTVAAEHRAIDPEGAGRLGAEFRHVLTRAIGTDESVAANICEVPHFKNDILVMCSDGLSDIVSEQEIMETVQRQPPQAACEALVNLANDRGGIDNITVIVVKVLKSGGNNSGIKNLLNRFKERIKRFGSGQGLAN